MREFLFGVARVLGDFSPRTSRPSLRTHMKHFYCSKTLFTLCCVRSVLF
ncbi:hypothetical protein HMPREF1584_01415 [Gardnerella vaginalis JCP8481A]|nr:hypothetical protein HMPREF1585_01428 [Gardnerella vaginalis JCP8481B]EPI40918.1 hypothetical protein HMPREF1584_01415 [Gardnerella vaginalis JCP8481A]